MIHACTFNHSYGLSIMGPWKPNHTPTTRDECTDYIPFLYLTYVTPKRIHAMKEAENGP